MGKQWCASVLIWFVQIVMIFTARYYYPNENITYLILAVGGTMPICVSMIASSFYGVNQGNNVFIAQVVLAAASSFFLVCFIALIKYWANFGGKMWQYLLAVILLIGEFLSVLFQIVISSTMEKNRKNFILKSTILAMPFGVSTVVGGVLLLRSFNEE